MIREHLRCFTKPLLVLGVVFAFAFGGGTPTGQHLLPQPVARLALARADAHEIFLKPSPVCKDGAEVVYFKASEFNPGDRVVIVDSATHEVHSDPAPASGDISGSLTVPSSFVAPLEIGRAVAATVSNDPAPQLVAKLACAVSSPPVSPPPTTNPPPHVVPPPPPPVHRHLPAARPPATGVKPGAVLPEQLAA